MIAIAAAKDVGLTLCKFSRSEILASSVLLTCPLKLNSSQSKSCPCKRRKYHVGAYDLRVIECLYPNTYRGQMIREPEKFRESVIAQAPVSKSSMSSNTKPGESKMSTSVADPPKNGASTKSTTPAKEKPAQSTTAAASPTNNPGLWCGIEIPIIGVSGEKGEGKTLFASSIDPENTAMCDLEDSSASYNLPFAKRWSLYEEMLKKFNRVPTPLECFEWFRNLITDEIKPGQFRVLAVDPITDIEQGMVDWVQANPEKFGHTKNQYEKAAGIMWGDVKSYWKMLLGIVATKVETFVFTAHMGAVWKGNQPVDGKRKAKGKETLFELASLYLQVERPIDAQGKRPDKPSARVLKSRLAVSKVVDGEVSHVPILPPYLQVATPKRIREYIKNPPNYAKLKESEIAPPEQMSDDDRLLIQAQIAEDKRVEAEANLSRMEQMKRAAEEQTRLKKEREAQQQANAAASDVNIPDGETITTATGTVLPKSHEALAGIQEAGDRQALKQMHARVKDLCSALQMSPAKIDEMLAKRGAKTIDGLNLAQAEEIRGKLQLVINKRTEAAKSGMEAAPFN